MSRERQEFNAGTVEEAADKASAALGIARDELSFAVLDGGSAGFLGIGARDARIIVEYPKTSADRVEPEEDDRRRDLLKEEPVTAPGEPAATRAGAPDEDRAAASEVPEDLIIAVDEFMTTLIGAMGIDATVDVYDAEDTVAADVATEETGLFIGRKGETIDAVQYLLNVVIYKDRPFLKRVVVDTEGYRQRRIEAIEGMAHRTARRVLREKRPLSLPPMSAGERRVVHLFLKDNPHVRTASEGKAESRKVVVSPV
jgi:spoIIIJ-associated protein